MEQLIKQIEQWASDRNIIKGSKPIDQAMKLFSEFGELADNVGKGRDCRDDIGDCAVVMAIIMAQCGLSFHAYAENLNFISQYDIKYNVAQLANNISEFVSDIATNYEISDNSDAFIWCIEYLNVIAMQVGSSLKECVQLAYDDIKHRKGIMANGLFIKESDPVYAQVISEIEGNYNA
ncbi:MazG-like pyrophosphatase [Acinetobacter phage vB_AbaM_AB3P2]|nr:MazG-like pyrophosphatase [Acinetobacter phage vB_AbaM_AB3P2]